MRLRRPRLPSHWLSWVDPPDESGLETLHLATAGRRVSVEGEFLRELWNLVLPLLDGAHALEELNLERASLEVLEELEELGVLIEGGPARLPIPQRNALQEWGLAPDEAEARLRQARVAVVGAGLIADSAAAALGELGCREVIRVAEVPDDLKPMSLAISAIDGSQTRKHLALQGAALRAGVPLLFCSANAAEIVLGPLAVPGETSCVLCFQSRALGCAAEPAVELERLRQLELQGRTDADQRETLPAAAALLAQMLAVEALHFLSGRAAETAGAIRVLTIPGFRSGLHPIAPVPRCPLCGGGGSSPQRLRDLVSDRTGLVRGVSLSGSAPKICTALLAHAEADPVLDVDRVALAAAIDEGAAIDAAVADALAFRSAMQIAHERIARADELDGRAVLPPELVLFSAEQHAERSCRGHRYRPGSPIGWVRGVELGNGEPVWLPGHLVQLGDLRPRPQDDFCRPTSSGLRAGASFAQAVEEAVLDLVAHDAFVVCWMLRLHPASVSEGEIGAAARVAIEAIRAEGDDVHLRELPTDAPARVVLAIATSTSGPAAVAQVAAHPSLAAASERALYRLFAVRHHERLRFAAGERIAPEQVVLEEDHALLFHSPEHARQLSFLLETGAAHAAEGSPRDLVSALRERDVRLFAADLTMPETRAAGLHVARVLATDLQPLHAGHRQERLGSARIARRAEALLGGARPQLNRFPHPLACGPRLLILNP